MNTLKEVKNLGLHYHSQNREVNQAHVNHIKEFITDNDKGAALSHMGTVIVSIYSILINFVLFVKLIIAL